MYSKIYFTMKVWFNTNVKRPDTIDLKYTELFKTYDQLKFVRFFCEMWV